MHRNKVSEFTEEELKSFHPHDKVIILFGKNAPEIHKKLCKDPSANEHPHVEKDVHHTKEELVHHKKGHKKKDDHTFYFVDLKDDKESYLVVRVTPSILEKHPHQKEGYTLKLQLALARADLIALCPDTKKADGVKETLADFEKLKAKYGSPRNKLKVFYIHPSFDVKPDQSPLSTFLAYQQFEPPVHLLGHHAPHFKLAQEMTTNVQPNQDPKSAQRSALC